MITIRYLKLLLLFLRKGVFEVKIRSVARWGKQGSENQFLKEFLCPKWHLKFVTVHSGSFRFILPGRFVVLKRGMFGLKQYEWKKYIVRLGAAVSPPRAHGGRPDQPRMVKCLAGRNNRTAGQAMLICYAQLIWSTVLVNKLM